MSQTKCKPTVCRHATFDKGVMADRDSSQISKIPYNNLPNTCKNNTYTLYMLYTLSIFDSE